VEILLVGHDAGGTVPPLVAIAAAAVGRGHAATVLGQPSMRARAEAVGARFVAFTELGDYRRDQPLEHQLDVTVAAIAGAAVGIDLQRVAAHTQTDVVVVDANLAGALAAAEALDRPGAVLLHSMYTTFVDTWFGDLWPLLADGITTTRAGFGLDAVGSWAEAFARHETLISVVPAVFDAPVADRPATLLHPGFLVPPAPTGDAVRPPEGDGPAALVGLSTTHQEHDALLQHIVDALAATGTRALVTTGGHVGASLDRVPDHVVVVDHAPHAAVLPHVDVVITHAGLGTVATALDAGVPLVCTPIARDQHLNTARVEALGVGRGAAHDPEAIAAALRHVLADTGTAQRASALAAESRAAGGADAVVDRLEEIAAAR
jgi:UDP:flavonoid glycosyltransferase YjiC (YdhE family)